jgi:hypothetical protein
MTYHGFSDRVNPPRLVMLIERSELRRVSGLDCPSDYGASPLAQGVQNCLEPVVGLVFAKGSTAWRLSSRIWQERFLGPQTAS